MSEATLKKLIAAVAVANALTQWKPDAEKLSIPEHNE